MDAYFSKFPVFGLVYCELDDVERKNVFVGFVDEVVLLELFSDEVLIVDEQRVELVAH